MAGKTLLPDRILAAALNIAEEKDWNAVSLIDVAKKVQISLAELYKYYPDKDLIIDAWFEKANMVMLQDATKATLKELAPKERLHFLIMAYLEVLGRHHRVTREMVFSRCTPGHLASQIKSLFKINRTSQWLHEILGNHSSGVQQVLEETALSAILVNTFVYWLYDDTPHFRHTRELLDKELSYAESASHVFEQFWHPFKKSVMEHRLHKNL